MTRVAYIGNYVVPWCTEVHVARALRENGCEVIEVSQDDAFKMGPAYFVAMVLEVECDMTLYTRTHNATALEPEWSRCWRVLAETHGIVTASFHLDRYFDLERERLIHEGDALFTTEHVFTADGGNDDRFAQAGVNHHWLPPAVDRTEAEMPGRFNRRMAHDVVFVGSGNYHREYPQRDELIWFLHDRYGSRFAHYGHGGGRPVVRGQALNDLYASAKVVVGDSCFANAPDWETKADRYISDRVLETLGRGGRLVHAWNDMLDGWPVVMHTPGHFDQLAECIDVMLENNEGYLHEDVLRHGGRAFVLRAHTYTHRMRELLCTVGLCEAEEVAA